MVLLVLMEFFLMLQAVERPLLFMIFCDSSLEVWKKNFLETQKNWNKKWCYFNILEIKCCSILRILDLGR